MARQNEKVNELQNKLRQKDHEIESIAAKTENDFVMKIKLLQEELEKCQTGKRKDEEELSKCKKLIKELQDEGTTEQSELNMKLKKSENLVEQLRKDLKNLREKFASVKSEKEEKESALHNIQQKQMQASYEIEQEKAYLDKVKEDFDKEKEMREIAEKKLEDLSNVSVRVSTVMKEKESLIEQMEEQARNRKVLEKELTEARIGNVQYSDQLTQLKEDMEKLHYQLNTIINERENIKHEILIERNQFMNEVNVEKERRQRLEEKYSQAEAELQRMHSSVEDMKSNFSLKVENRNRSIFELENVVNEMKMKSIQQNNFIQEHESNVEDLKHKMKCLESEKNAKIDELEKNVKNMEISKNLAIEESKNVQEENAKLQENMKMLSLEANDQRDALANELAERHDIIVKLKSDFSVLQKKHQASVIKLSENADKLNQMKVECCDYKSKNDELVKKMKDITMNFDNVQKKFSDCENELQSKEKSIHEMAEAYVSQVL